jgi:hypothetical protein
LGRPVFGSSLSFGCVFGFAKFRRKKAGPCSQGRKNTTLGFSSFLGLKLPLPRSAGKNLHLPAVSGCVCYQAAHSASQESSQEYKAGVVCGKGHFFLRRLRGRVDLGVFAIGLPIKRYKCGGKVVAYRECPFLESQQKSEISFKFFSKSVRRFLGIE